jgi:hypothetical protein
MSELGEEMPIQEGSANFQRNVETVGGKLSLFDEKLVFEPHAVNVQKEGVIIQLASISKVDMGWTKFLGFIPLLPNALIISSGNKCYRFTVFNRKAWVENINSCRYRLP